MSKRRSLTRLPLVATLSVGLSGCMGENPLAPGAATGPAPLPPALQSDNVRITNDPDALEARIERTYEPLTVLAKSPTRDELSGAFKSNLGAQLTLVGTVRPPVVDGTIVQANDVDIDGTRAVVSFNTAGEVFAGAVQVIDFSIPARPRIVSEVLYRDADVNAVALLGNHLYVGMSSDDPTLASPALLEELDLTGTNLSQTGVWVDLPSWACTDLAVHGDGVVASVGALGGGVAFLSRGVGLEIAGFAPQFDVRSVAMDVDAAMGVGGGEGILERRLLPAMTLEAQVRVDGYRNEAAKGTIEVYAHRCYLGAGDGGMQVRGSDGAWLDGLSCSDLTSSGELAVVNAVSCANRLAFVAAGPQGIQVVDLGRFRCDGLESGETAGLRLLGQLGLENGASCNMIKAKNDLLVVAAGTGGVKLVSMRFEE